MKMNAKLKARRAKKMKKPVFLRPGATHTKRFGMKWRYPSGNQSKLRLHKKNKGALPGAGYGSPTDVRGMHPSGLKEVMVFNPYQLAGLNSGSEAVRIASSVGNLKRMAIQRKAEEMKIRVLNPRKIELRRAVKEAPQAKPHAKEEKK
jgi:large subunit ribosomal protein L32e